MLTARKAEFFSVMKEAGLNLEAEELRAEYERVCSELQRALNECADSKKKLLVAGQLLSETVAENENLERAKDLAELQLRQSVIESADRGTHIESVQEVSESLQLRLTASEYRNSQLSIDLEGLKLQNDHLKQELIETSAKEDEPSIPLAQQSQEIQQLHIQLRELKSKEESAISQAHSFQEANEALKLEVERLRAENEALACHSGTNAETLSAADASRDYYQNLADDLRQQLDARDARVVELTEQLNDGEKARDLLRAQLNSAVTASESSTLDLRAANEELSTLKAAMAAKESTAEAFQLQVAQLRASVDEHVTAFQDQTERHDNDYKSLDNVIKELTFAKTSLEKTLNMKVSNLEESLAQKELELAASCNALAEASERALKSESLLCSLELKHADESEKVAAELELLRLQANDLVARNQSLVAEVDSLTQSSKAIQSDTHVDEFQKQLAGLEAKRKEQEEESVRQIKELDSTLERQRDHILQLQAELGQVASEKSRIKAEAEGLYERVATLDKSHKESLRKLEVKDSLVSRLKSDLQDFRERVSADVQREQELRDCLARVEAQLAKPHVNEPTVEQQSGSGLIHEEAPPESVALDTSMQSDDVDQTNSFLRGRVSELEEVVQLKSEEIESLFSKQRHLETEVTQLSSRDQLLTSVILKYRPLKTSYTAIFSNAATDERLLTYCCELVEFMLSTLFDVFAKHSLPIPSSATEIESALHAVSASALSHGELKRQIEEMSQHYTAELNEAAEKLKNLEKKLKVKSDALAEAKAKPEELGLLNAKLQAECSEIRGTLDKYEEERRQVLLSLKIATPALLIQGSSLSVAPIGDLPKLLESQSLPIASQVAPSPSQQFLPSDNIFKTPRTRHYNSSSASESPSRSSTTGYRRNSESFIIKIDDAVSKAFSLEEVSRFKLQSEQLEFFLGQFEAMQTVIEDQKAEIAGLKDALESLLGQADTCDSSKQAAASSLVKVLKTQCDELRKVWAQGLSANQALRGLVAKVQQDIWRKFAHWRDHAVSQDQALIKLSEKLTRSELELQSSVADYEEKLNLQLSKTIASERHWMSELETKQREVDQLLDKVSSLEQSNASSGLRQKAVLDELHEKVLAYEEHCAALQSKLNREQAERVRVLSDLKTLQVAAQAKSNPPSVLHYKSNTVTSTATSEDEAAGLFERKYQGYKAYCKQLLHECKLLQLSTVRLSQFRKDLSYQKQYLSRRVTELEHSEMQYLKFLAGANLADPNSSVDASFVSAGAHSYFTPGEPPQKWMLPGQTASSLLLQPVSMLFKFKSSVFAIVAMLRFLKTQRLAQEFFATNRAVNADT